MSPPPEKFSGERSGRNQKCFSSPDLPVHHTHSPPLALPRATTPLSPPPRRCHATLHHLHHLVTTLSTPLPRPIPPSSSSQPPPTTTKGASGLIMAPRGVCFNRTAAKGALVLNVTQRVWLLFGGFGTAGGFLAYGFGIPPAGGVLFSVS
ncbi:hypothetical protein Tco_1464707 [Tanacetum coccineum]